MLCYPSQPMDCHETSFLVIEKLENSLDFLVGFLSIDVGTHEEDKILKCDHACTLLIHITDKLIQCAILCLRTFSFDCAFEI